MNKGLSLLSIAAKAGRVASGETATEQAVRRGKASLVILASDASENTRKKFTNLCRTAGVPLKIFEQKETLGRAIGKGERSNLAVTDESLAAGIMKRIDEERSVL